MQFHLDGFRPGDPHVVPAQREPRTGALPDKVDVLVSGGGPAGLTLAAQLSAFPEIDTLLVEQKSGPLQLGQADGVACRTVEMFEAFGFAERVLKEAYWVNETAFWAPGSNGIFRSGRVQDTEDGLSEFPHVILNQARVHDLYLDVMRNAPTRLEPVYGWRLVDFEIDDSNASHPVAVQLERVGPDGAGMTRCIRARYLVGCDGARSAVRRGLGYELHGDAANQLWGVMDVLAITDFPDIRLKSLIRSADEGSVLIIPREGGYLVRLYIELDKLAKGERVGRNDISAEQLVAAAQRIMKPYTLDVKEIAWWSVYEIGQRLCDRFDDSVEGSQRSPRVFIAGDACHTHSPKAGQGMNVSMQDTFNLGWKLAAVLRGQAREELLNSYSVERQAIARELIEFDREWASLLSRDSGADGKIVNPEETQRYFVRHGRYTAGTATRYSPSIITCDTRYQKLASGLPVGMRFHSAPVIRLADAKPVQLGHVVKADGRWRIFAFAGAGDPDAESSPVAKLCDFLERSRMSPLRRHTPAGADVDAVIDLRAVFQQHHRDLDVMRLPRLLVPAKGRLGLRDYEKSFCPDHAADIFDLRGIDRQQGCMVIVRPDQYVAHVLPLDAHDALAEFFAGFLIQRDASEPIASRQVAESIAAGEDA